MTSSKKNKVAAAVEGVLFLLCLVSISALRLNAVHSVEANSFFDEAAITAGKQMELTGFGGRDLYLLLLHGMLFLLGNKIAAAAMLQAVLQIASAVLLYVGVRRVSGRATALIALATWGFLPFLVRAYMELSPNALIFALECLVLCTISGIWKHWNRENSDGSPADALLRYLYIGLLIGLCCSMDLSGFLVLFFLLWVIFFCRRKGTGGMWSDPSGFWNNRGFTCAFCLVAGLVSFVGMQVLFGVLSGNNPPYALKMWLQEIVSGSFRNVFVLLYLFCLSVAGRVIEPLLRRKAEEKNSPQEKTEKEETQEKEETEKKADSDIQYIENPLPLPKKVEKKRLDYDYEVADDDDYDIP